MLVSESFSKISFSWVLAQQHFYFSQLKDSLGFWFFILALTIYLVFSWFASARVASPITAKAGFSLPLRSEEGSAIKFSEHFTLIYPDLNVDISYDRSLI